MLSGLSPEGRGGRGGGLPGECSGHPALDALIFPWRSFWALWRRRSLAPPLTHPSITGFPQPLAAPVFPALLSGPSPAPGQELTCSWPGRGPRQLSTCPRDGAPGQGRAAAGQPAQGEREVARETHSQMGTETNPQTDVDPGPGTAQAAEGRRPSASPNGALDRAADAWTGAPEAPSPCAPLRCQRPELRGPRGPGCKHRQARFLCALLLGLGSSQSLSWRGRQVPNSAFLASQKPGCGLGATPPLPTHTPEELLWPEGPLRGAGVRP